MNPEILRGFYLGDSLVEPLTGQISGQSGSVHLPPKAVEVLLCLVKEPGELVTRDALLEQVWGAGQGSQEALSHAVSDIRHALNDHADNPTFVQTLPKRGYRLLVTPEIASTSTTSTVQRTEERRSGSAAPTTNVGFIENLKQRGVLETGLAYLVLGWLVIQVTDIFSEQLYLEPWVGTFITVGIIAGFPIALVLSWFIEFRHGRATLHELSPADAKRHRFGRTYLAVIGALMIAAIGVYVFDQRIGLPGANLPEESSSSPSVQLPPILENSFAVLPFLNLDGSDVTQIFANGLVEDVITRLSRVPGLRVASRGDSFSLAPNSSSNKVRERLRVAMYLEGSVQMANEKMRVTVQLVDSETGFHVLSRSFDRALEDFFAVRDEITSLTVANIRVALPPNMQASSLSVLEHPSLDAYVLYRRGIDASHKPTSIDTISTALGWFDAAIDVDNEYAAAYAGKCNVYVVGYAQVDDPSYIQNAETACATALELNPNIDVVHTALGNLYRTTGQYAEAEAAYEKALTIDPESVLSLTGLGEIYLRQKRIDEAEASLRQAIGLHPGDTNAYITLGTFLFRTGRFEEAAAQYASAVAINPDNMNAYSSLGAAYMQVGNFAAAAPAFQRAIEIEPRKKAYANLGLMHYYLGDLDAAIANHSSAVELEPNDYLAHSNLADALWVAGRTDDARAEFEHAEALAITALQVNPQDAFTLMDLAWIRAMLDKSQVARDMMDRARAAAPDDPYTHYYDALIHLRAGEESAALESLEIAAEKGYALKMLAAEPLLEPLKDEPRFAAIVDVE